MWQRIKDAVDWYNVLRTVTQALIVAVGAALGAVSQDWLRSIGLDAATAEIGAIVALALASWWRQNHQDAFERPPR